MTQTVPELTVDKALVAVGSLSRATRSGACEDAQCQLLQEWPSGAVVQPPSLNRHGFIKSGETCVAQVQCCLVPLRISYVVLKLRRKVSVPLSGGIMGEAVTIRIEADRIINCISFFLRLAST